MESLKKIFLFVLVGLFLINFSSAGLFDPGSEVAFHEEGKNGKYGYYEINDTDFWFFNNKPIKTIELIENEYSIFTAWNIKEIEVFKPKKLFDKTNYLDKEQNNDRSNLISSETHLYREWETKIRNINNQSCITYETTENQTQVCSEWQDNSYEEEYEEWSDWKLYNFGIVQEGLYQTKTIVTRNNQNTGTIDWVDENEGWDLDEWATWWDSDWEKKRVINFTGNIGNFSYIESIPHNASMQSDFDDLRFLDFATESVELNYTIESFIASTSVRVRVFSQGEDAIVMYYGNDGVGTTSSSFNTHLQPNNFWYMDESSGAVLDSTGTNNATNVGAEPNVTGQIGTAYQFVKGEGDVINTDDNLGISGSADRTFSFWSKVDTTSSRIVWFGYGADATGDRFVANFEGTGTKIDVYAGSVSFTRTPSTTLWEQNVVIYDGSNNTVSWWIDGANMLNSSVVSAAVTTTNSILKIGDDAFYNYPFDGKIDEMIIYDRILNNEDRVRITSYTEPTYTIGAEQANLNIEITLISPEDALQTTTTLTNFTFQSSPNNVNLTNATLNIWNATDSALLISNFTTLSGNESVNTTFINNLTQGNYLWGAVTQGTSGISDTSVNRTLTVHTTIPDVIIHDPQPIIDYHVLGTNLTLNWTVLEQGENLTTHITNCTYKYNGVLIILNNTECTQINQSSFLYVNGVNNLTFNVTDILGLVNSTIVEWDFTILELNQTFEENITEGELADFSLLLNISSVSSLTDATFSYNDTNYTTTIVFSSGLYLISSLITSPTVDVDTNFSFNFFFVVDGINYSTSINQQLVVNSLFDICGGLSNDTLLNMSLVDEETGTNISGTIEIIAEIVSQSSGIIIGTINNTFENVEYGAICFSPVSSYPLYNLNTEIKYFSDGYVTELYYIQNSDMANYPRNLTLFSLNQSDSTEFVVTFQNDAFIFIEGAIIQLQRKYIGENVYKVVEAPITSDGGKAIVHIDLNTNIYRASVVKEGVLLKFFDEIVFSCDNELAGECNQQLRGDVNPNNDVPIETITDFSYSVSVSDENNTVDVLFSIPSGTPSSINVLLEQIDMFGNSTSCNTTVITSAGSITCDFSDTIEKSILQLTISKDGTQLAITNYGVDPELDMDGINFFIVFLFLISLVGMAIASPEWMMIIGIMVFMISGTLLLLKGMSLAMGLGAMAWLVVAVIIIILKMAKQEDR